MIITNVEVINNGDGTLKVVLTTNEDIIQDSIKSITLYLDGKEVFPSEVDE